VNPFVPDFVLQNDAQGRAVGEFEGAALFVDISGFTPLSESLLAHGREGAEALAHALRFHFDPLIAAVHEAGGFITGFAGDACTALFPEGPTSGAAGHDGGRPHAPGENAASRALGAAHRMQRFLAENPVYESPYGHFPFSIRIGLSWGRVAWGIVRVVPPPVVQTEGGPTSHRLRPARAFYYFQGPAVDACAAVEHRARAGEVLLDDAFRRFVPEADIGPAEGEIFRAGTPVEPAARLAPSWIPASGAGAEFVAPGVSEIPPQGEFRDVVSCFIAFDEVSDVAFDVPGLIRLLDELAAGYGGTFTGLDFGDKGTNTLIHFGAPVSHENDTERALDFVNELRRVLPAPIRLRAGITRDIRYVGWNGGTRRQEFACLGRATNLAARFMMQAARGEVLCDATVFADAGGGYAFEPRGELVLRGFEQPVTAHALGAKRPSFTKERTFAAKELVGRAAELARLLSSVAPIFSGRFAGLIYVDGEAGLGKSFLVESARRRVEARGTPLLWIEAPCDQTLQRSLNAFEVALKEYFGQSPDSTKEQNLARFEEIAARLVSRVPAGEEALRAEIAGSRSIYAALVGHRSPGSLYERLSPRDRFDRTLAAIAAWVRAESRLGPVVVHVEDAHWADGDTLRAVQAIARLGKSEEGKGPRLVPGLPIAVVCTARYTDDGGPFRIVLDPGVPVRNIGLAPLSPEEIGRIAENAGGRGIPDLFRAMLIDGAGGNPFFAEEIFAYWNDTEVPYSEPSISSPSVALLPTDVNSMLVARLDRLSPRVKLTVLAAAVLGKEFDVRVLGAMAAGDPELAEHVRVAVAQRIFLKQGPVRYAFRNTLLRNAAYEVQARARLARLHLLAAEAIEAVHEADLERHFSALGRHYRRAGLADKARPYYLAAAREAAARYAHTEAKRQYRSYFKLVGEPTPESVIARYELARDVYEPRGDVARAFDEHARVIHEAQILGDGATEALGRLGLGRATWASGRLEEARTYLDQALAGARREKHRWTEALALAHLALVHRAAGLEPEAVEVFTQALRLGHTLGMAEGATVFGDMVAHDLLAHRPQETLTLYQEAMSQHRGARDTGA
jgi:class 3 adenylate cyclase/tetratricopeptide (TPR) repeat protein